jgi:hypothetical protein
MRPYDPDNQAHRDAASPANSANDSAGYTGDGDAGIAGTTFSPVAQPGFVDISVPGVEQEIDYTYNSSLDMEDTVSNTADPVGAVAGENMPYQAALTASDTSEKLDDSSRVTYRVNSAPPPDAIDVTPRDHDSHGLAHNGKSNGDGEAESATDETEAIRANIEHTRSQMSATIDAIQEKLSPHNLVDQAKDAVRDATIGRVENMVTDVRNTAQEAGSGFLDTVKENPIPAALAAVGIGWLFMKSRNKGENYRAGYYNSYDRYNASDAYGRFPSGGPSRYGSGGYDYARDGSQENMLERAQDKAGDVADKVGQTVGDKASQVGSAVGNVAGQARDALGDAAGAVGDAAGNLAGTIQDRAGDIGSGVQYGAQRAQNQLQRMLYENPLAVGGVALAIGAAIGMMLPETEPEQKLMGEARDTVLEKAQNVAQDTLDKVSRVAQEVGNTAKEEARKQDLTS